ncbi:MAG: hypothetical protein ABSE82_15205, partial [Nitrososphaerales archaeon]
MSAGAEAEMMKTVQAWTFSLAMVWLFVMRGCFTSLNIESRWKLPVWLDPGNVALESPRSSALS